jgi:hypothetical protein
MGLIFVIRLRFWAHYKKKIHPNMGTHESSVGKVWPLSIKGENVFCACSRNGKWQEGENIIILPHNFPIIVGEFCYIQRCCETYVFSKRIMYGPNLLPSFHFLKGVLANWCQMFGVHFNVNQPLVSGWEFEWTTKIYDHLLIFLIIGVHVSFKICPRS